MEDVDLLRTHFVGPARGHEALNVVGGHHAEIGDFLRRAVHHGLVGLADFGLSEAGPGIAGADHKEAGLIQFRHGDFGRAGVVGANIGHHIGIGDRLVGVGRFHGGVPLAALGRGVVPRFIHQRKAARLGSGLFDGQLDAIDHGFGLGVRAARVGQAGNDLDGLGILRAHGRGGQCEGGGRCFQEIAT